MSSTLLQILPCRAEYDSRLESTELHTLRFLVDTLRREPPLERALEFGAGSTLHHAIALAARTRELHPPDLLPGNLRALRRWLCDAPGAQDCSEFTRAVLRQGLRVSPYPDKLSRCLTLLTSLCTYL